MFNLTCDMCNQYISHNDTHDSVSSQNDGNKNGNIIPNNATTVHNHDIISFFNIIPEKVFLPNA